MPQFEVYGRMLTESVIRRALLVFVGTLRDSGVNITEPTVETYQSLDVLDTNVTVAFKIRPRN